MEKFFCITWKERKPLAIVRNSHIMVYGGDDRKSNVATAINLFEKSFGNLNKNQILCIQEKDKNGDDIGEPILPE